MTAATFHRAIVSERAGVWAAPLRGLLRLIEPVYATGIALRNALYDRRGPTVTLPVPVISVGNLTVGGTGKTPLVIELVRRLNAMGLSPAVVSRGYGTDAPDGNDEERLIRQRCPGVTCVSHPNRSFAGDLAHRRFGADVIVLDDGFQHRRLARSLDIVLLDATCPFGFDHLLPRGLLREPVASLRRAHLVVLTRCDQASPAGLSEIDARVGRVAPDVPRLRCSHRVTAIETLDGQALTAPLTGRRAVVFAGIGHPAAFLTTVRSLGVEVVGERWWPDHHRYRRGDIHALTAAGRFPPHDLLFTTEKDAVKLAPLGTPGHLGIAVVKVAIEFDERDDATLQAALAQSLKRG